MERISVPAKMSKLNLNCMFFEIILSMKGSSFRARSSSLAEICNVNNIRPEATSKKSYDNAIQRLIPKIKDALKGTNKHLGEILQDESGQLVFSVKDIVYNDTSSQLQQNTQINSFPSEITEFFKNLSMYIPINNIRQSIDTTSESNFIANSSDTVNTTETLKFSNICIEWLQYLLERTKKNYNDEDYLSPGTLEDYNKNLRKYIFIYLDEHPEYDNINSFSEKCIDEILNNINCRTTRRILLQCLKSIFDFAKQHSYITSNPIAMKKQKRKKKVKKDYDFIEEENRTKWINYMLEDIYSKELVDSDAPLAFLCTLLHGNRPEETCGTKWIDFNFKENDYHIQNAYKNLPIYDETSMKRIGWKKGDGPLKTPESDRHLSLDLLFKQLLLEHRLKQIQKYRALGKKWSINEYVFHNSSGTPFTPDILSKNFKKFIIRHNLPNIVIYGLRHSFATHCRNLGVKPEVLAKLMGHTEYQTTQKYYIHISQKQKHEALQKVQQQDFNHYFEKKNQHFEYLQNKINTCSKTVSNLQQVQQEDMSYYLQLNDTTMGILKNIIIKINEKQNFTI